jgi:Mg2+ and Co2+ transporter CorA
MQGLGRRYGYIGALASMPVAGLALYFYFREIKWL